MESRGKTVPITSWRIWNSLIFFKEGKKFFSCCHLKKKPRKLITSLLISPFKKPLKEKKYKKIMSLEGLSLDESIIEDVERVQDRLFTGENDIVKLK